MTVSGQDSEAPTVVARIHFGRINLSGHTTHYISEVSLRDLARRPNVRVLFCANPSTSDLFRIWLFKCFLQPQVRVAVFDLILRRPTNLRQRAIARVKALLLRAIDLFLFIHKDTSGYQQYYGVDAGKCEYVPFKANNLDLIDSITSTDGSYVISCGASQRDFDTLLRAVGPLGYRTIIVLSDRAAREHNALLDERLMSSCVERLRDVDGRRAWSELLANSRLVVVPIIEHTLQPAGISVYLEAMALGKPVIVSSGSSTKGILSDQHASIVAAGDPEALRAAIRNLWESASARQRLGATGRAFALSLGGNERMAGDIETHLARFGTRTNDA